MIVGIAIVAAIVLYIVLMQHGPAICYNAAMCVKLGMLYKMMKIAAIAIVMFCFQ